MSADLNGDHLIWPICAIDLPIWGIESVAIVRSCWMTMRRIAILLLCLMPIALYGEDRGLTEDGTFWSGLTLAEKYSFVQGYAHGYVAGEGDMESAFNVPVAQSFNHSIANRDKPIEITFQILVEGVDKCYSDFRNSRLNVEFCVDWTVRGVKGESDADREQYLAAMRRSAASHS